MSRINFLKTALESAQIDAAQQAQVLAEDAISDVNEEAGYQQDCIGQVDEAIDTTSALEDLILAAEPLEGECQEIPQSTERVLAIAVEQACVKLGIPNSTFSMEAEGGSVLERAKNFVKTLWEKIVQIFSQVYETIKDFLAVAFNAAARIEKSAIAKLRESRKLEGPYKRSTYSNREMARALRGDPSVGLIKLFDRTLDLTEIAVSASYSEPAKKVEEIIGKFFNDATSSPEAVGFEGGPSKHDEIANKLGNDLLGLISKSYTGNFLKVMTGATNLDAADAPEGTTVYVSPELMGSYGAVLIVPNSVENISKFSFKIIPVDSDGETSNDVSVSDIREQEQLLKQVITNCGQIRRFEKEVKIFDQLKARYFASSQANFVKKQSKDGSDHKYSDEGRQILRLIASSLPKITQGIHHRTFAFALNNCRTILKHIDHSFAAWN